MTHRPVGIVALTLALAACQTAGPTGAGKRTPVPTAVRATGAGGEPAGEPSARATDEAPAAGPLRAPRGTTRLAGVLSIDAAYAVAAGGRLIGDAVAPPGAGPDAGFGLIANNGAAIISDHGVGLIGNHGGAVVSNNGGAVVSNGGAGLIGKTKLRLLQAGAPLPGTTRPAAGMWIGLVSLLDGKPLPIGEDGRGQAVYTIATDARGAFELHVPAGLREKNVGVVAIAPGKPDARLAYGFVTAPKAEAGLKLDEDAALASDLLRHILIVRIDRAFLENTPTATPKPGEDPVRSAVKLQLGPILDRLRQAALESGIERVPQAARGRVYQRFADAVCAFTDLAAIEVQAIAGRPAGPALVALGESLRAIREAAGRKLAQDPYFFDGRAYMLRTNARRVARGEAPLAVRRAADVGELITREYLGPSEDAVGAEVPELLADLGLPADHVEPMKAAGAAIFGALGLTLLSDAAVQDDLVAAIRRAVAGELANPGATPATPVPPSPKWTLPPLKEPAVTVATLAGTGEAAWRDGPAASAAFERPLAVALDPDRQLLYVGEGGPHGLRRIALAEPGMPVTTVTGFDLDAPPDAAPDRLHLSLVSDLVFVPGDPPSLFVVERNGHRVSRVTLPPDGPARVELVAGRFTDPPTTVDGVGAGARFNGPVALAYDGANTLWVGEEDGRCVRRIDLAAPGGARVTTISGPNRGVPPGNWQPGKLSETYLGSVNGLGWAPGHGLLIAPTDTGRILLVDEAGMARAAVGSGERGSVDGLLEAGRVNGPRRFTRAADGSFVIADLDAHKVLRLRLVGAGLGTITTIAGSGEPGPAGGAVVDGPGETARFRGVAQAVEAPDGTIYAADSDSQRIRVIKKR